jgi:hypothetical protein
MSTKNAKPEDVKPGDDLAAEREAALAEKKTVIDLPVGEKVGPALRVDH